MYKTSLANGSKFIPSKETSTPPKPTKEKTDDRVLELEHVIIMLEKENKELKRKLNENTRISEDYLHRSSAYTTFQITNPFSSTGIIRTDTE